MRVHGADTDGSKSRGVRVEPPAASANVLRMLQGAAGNRAVSRLLRSHPELVGPSRPRLMRLPVELENLKDASRTSGRGLGASIPGSRIPHMVHNYWLPTEADGDPVAHTYDPDTWVNGPVQTPTAQNVAPADDLRVAIMATVKRSEIVEGIQRWACTDTILKSIVQYFVLRANEPTKWYAPTEEGDAHVRLEARDTMVTTPARRRLTMHLLTLRASAHWRLNSMNVLNREEIVISPTIAKKAQPDIQVKPKWDAVIKALRERVKARLAEEINNPGTNVPPPVGNRSLLDDEIIAALRDDEELGKVITRNHIEMQEDGTWKFFPERKNGTESTTMDQASLKGLSNALRHLRFLIYIEWRAAYELLANSRRLM